MLRPGPGQLEPLTTTGMMTAVMIAAFIACTALATALRAAPVAFWHFVHR